METHITDEVSDCGATSPAAKPDATVANNQSVAEVSPLSKWDTKEFSGRLCGGNGLMLALASQRQFAGACENHVAERFVTVIHRDPEGGFWAEVPALPGCYSQGETVDELMENIREAIAGVLEVMKEDGKLPEEDIQVLEVAV